MSYQVLARKYRPKTFEEVVGQEAVVRALTHALKQNRLHHAYLFTGTRGVGKTTLARILAKSLNCVGLDGKGGITDHPCGQCEVCRAIDEGRFVDYIEMDAASNRSVEEMTQLLEQAMYAPTNARFKVYMIDEVHQLTTHAFNAMLKTLEEPPEYVKFILATTDPQKVPVTVLSRCLQFNLRNVSPQVVASHLEGILKKEGIAAEPQALKLLGTAARGSMRDGLSLLDQAISYAGDEAVTAQSVRAMLGILEGDVLSDILLAIAREDAPGVMATASRMAQEGASFAEALKDLASLLHRVALAQKIPATLARDDLDYAAVKSLCGAFTPEEVQLFYQIALHGRADMNLAPDEYAGFTMTLLRMLAFKPAGSRLEAKPRVASAGEGPSGPFEDAAGAADAPAGPAVEPAPAIQNKVPAMKPRAAVLAPKQAAKTPPVAAEKPVAPEVPAQLPAPAPGAVDEDDAPEELEALADDFGYAPSDFATTIGPEAEPETEEIVPEVAPEPADAYDETLLEESELGRLWMAKMGRMFPASYAREIIENAELARCEEGAVTLRLEAIYESRTKNPAAMTLLQKMVDAAFGAQMRIAFEFAAPRSRTIAQARRAARKALAPQAELDDRERSAAAALIRATPQAKTLSRVFEATLLTDTIRKA